jgi:hypothetical protein
LLSSVRICATARVGAPESHRVHRAAREAAELLADPARIRRPDPVRRTLPAARCRVCSVPVRTRGATCKPAQLARFEVDEDTDRKVLEWRARWGLQSAALVVLWYFAHAFRRPVSLDFT